jgi:hypothetical protein
VEALRRGGRGELEESLQRAVEEARVSLCAFHGVCLPARGDPIPDTAATAPQEEEEEREGKRGRETERREEHRERVRDREREGGRGKGEKREDELHE